jgi:hypothetical protein
VTRFSRRIILSFVLIATVMGAIFAKLLFEGNDALKNARSSRKADQFEESLRFYKTSASFAAPGNSYAEAAREELLSLARSEQDPSKRREAFEALKRSLMSSRNFLAPWREDDPLMQEISIELEKAYGPQNLTLVDEQFYPKYGWQILCQILFWGWILSLSITIWKGFRPNGEMIRTPLMRGGLCSTLFLVLWLMCLTKA